MFLSILKKKRREIFIFFLLALLFYRSPHIFLNGRFMAEEGSIFFKFAYLNNFFDTLFFIDFFSGYINLWANISAIISNLFPLKFSPLISNYLSLIPKFLIIFYAIYKKNIFIDNFYYQIIFILIIFISPLNVPEIWMNSINSQIFFAIIVFFLIFLKYDKSKYYRVNAFILVIAGLTGFYSCIFFPIYFLKFIYHKTKQDFLNFIILSICTFLQLTVVTYSKFSNALYEGKLHLINSELMINYVYNVIIKSFLGTDLTKYIYYNFLNNINLIFLSMVIVILLIAILILNLNNLKNINLKKKNYQENNFILITILYSFIATSFLVLIGGVGDYVGGRYAALPSFYFLVFFIFIHKFSKKSLLKYLSLILLTSSIFFGGISFKDNDYSYYLECKGCPNWFDEVKKFNQDNTYLIKIWPYPRKTMQLFN
jgi:hypothetical protein